MLKRLAIYGLASVTWFSALDQDVEAAFHDWDISEVYTNADGTVQFIELFVSSVTNEQFLYGRAITSNSNTFTFPGNSPPTSTNRLLIATPGFASLPGAVAPDFTLLVTNFFSASSDTIRFAPNEFPCSASGCDFVTILNAPTDGINSTHFINPIGVAVNSPTNFANVAGELDLPLLGDMDDDGDVNTGDVAPFIQALTDREAFNLAHPTVDADVIGNVNGDSQFDLGDIAEFQSLVNASASATGQGVPEPSTLLLVAMLTCGLVVVRERRCRG